MAMLFCRPFRNSASPSISLELKLRKSGIHLSALKILVCAADRTKLTEHLGVYGS